MSKLSLFERFYVFVDGVYSLVIVCVVLAILVVTNIFASALPETLTKYDISAVKLYSVTSNTKAVVNGLSEDVTIYWVVQSGEEDDVIENLLGKYDSLSDHIRVEKKNPDVYPTFTEQYTDESVPNNSLIVVSGDRSRYVSYNDIYAEDVDVYSYTYTTSFSLLTEGQVPEEADCVLIYAPSSDISEEEKELLAQYVADGGKLMVSAGPVEDGSLENLCSLLEDYGITAHEGIVIESDQGYYSFGYPYLLLPKMESNEITDSLIDENYYVFMPVAMGLTVPESSDKGNVTSLLSTSDASYSKTAGYQLESYEKEKDDIDGPFSVAVSIEDNGGGKIVWFTSSYFLEDMYNAYSSGADTDLGMNALSSLIGEREAISIRSKSLNYNYLTISESTSSALRVMMIGVFPLLYLGIGITVIAVRRRKQNETS